MSGSNVRVSMVTFGDGVESKVSFKQGSDATSVTNAIRGIKSMTGPRRLDKMLRYAASDVFTIMDGHRPKVNTLLWEISVIKWVIHGKRSITEKRKILGFRVFHAPFVHYVRSLT